MWYCFRFELAWNNVVLPPFFICLRLLCIFLSFERVVFSHTIIDQLLQNSTTFVESCYVINSSNPTFLGITLLRQLGKQEFLIDTTKMCDGGISRIFRHTIY